MPEIRNRTIRYGAVLALDDVTFAVQPGERVAVVGPNGAGKTTLLRALVGPGTAVVPQDVPANLALGCRDFVMLGRTAHLSAWHAPARADKEAVDRALAAVDAVDLAGRRMDAISGGERQRLAIALALATEAPVLLLDEPAAHLDFRRRVELMALLARLDRTVVMTTHELPFDTDFFTRVVLLAHGRIVADGHPAEVLTSAHISSAWGVPVTLREVRTASVAVAAGRLGNLEIGRTLPQLPISKTPSGESKEEKKQDGDVAIAAGRLGDLETGGTAPQLLNSKSPSSESMGEMNQDGDVAVAAGRLGD